MEATWVAFGISLKLCRVELTQSFWPRLLEEINDIRQ